MNLDTWGSFHHESYAPTNTYRMRFVNTDPYHFFLVGGYTQGWTGRSVHNWFRWDDATQRIVHTGKTMANHHDHAPAVGVPVNAARTSTCTAPYALP